MSSMRLRVPVDESPSQPEARSIKYVLHQHPSWGSPLALALLGSLQRWKISVFRGLLRYFNRVARAGVWLIYLLAIMMSISPFLTAAHYKIGHGSTGV